MKNSSLHKKRELFVDVLCHMVVLDAAPRPTPLSPVPESSTGSQSIHGLGVPGAAPLSMCLHVDLASHISLRQGQRAPTGSCHQFWKERSDGPVLGAVPQQAQEMLLFLPTGHQNPLRRLPV